MRDREAFRNSDFASAIGAGIMLWVVLYLTESFVNASPGLHRGIDQWGIGPALLLLVGCILVGVALRYFFVRMKLSILQAAGIGALLALMPILANMDVFNASDRYAVIRKALLFIALVSTSVAVFRLTNGRRGSVAPQV